MSTFNPSPTQPINQSTNQLINYSTPYVYGKTRPVNRRCLLVTAGNFTAMATGKTVNERRKKRIWLYNGIHFIHSNHYSDGRYWEM